MRPYISLFQARARALFQYRIAALAGLATQWAFGFVMISILTAFFAEDAAQPMSLAQTVTYTWLGQALLAIIPWNLDPETAESIRTGAVAYDLARPLGLQAHWYVRCLAMRLAPTLLKSIPMFLIATFFMPEGLAMQWPALPVVFSWLLSLVGAVFLSASLTVLMLTALFWTVTGDGIARLVPNIAIVLTGLNLPLPLYPDWMQGLLRYQPFAGVMSTPNLIFIGNIPHQEVFLHLGLQIFWTAFFLILGKLILRRGLRRLTVAGG